MEQREENSSLVCTINDNNHSNNTTLDSGEIQPGCIHPHGVPLLEDMGYNDEIGDDVSKRYYTNKTRRGCGVV